MSSKRQRRLESKKRKAEALLMLTALNDEEGRGAKATKTEKPPTVDAEQKKELLHGLDYEALRARLRARKKLLQSVPEFTLKAVGREAELDVSENFRTPLFMNDIQHLLLYALMGAKAPVEPGRWCKFNRWSQLSNIVCVVLEGLGVDDFQRWQKEKKFQETYHIFTTKLEMIAPAAYGSTVANDLSVLPLSTNLKQKLKRRFGNLEEATRNNEDYFNVFRSVFPMTDPKDVVRERKKLKEEKKRLEDNRSNPVPLKLRLLLNLTQMIEENYPVPLKGIMESKYSDYVMTSDRYEPLTASSPMYSIDCEMCLTADRKQELTRVCMVDSDLNVIYHSFVLPRSPIVNYLTKFSGITKEMLEGVTTRIEDVQEAIRKILPPNAILVGQSLCSDLKALKMVHPYVIDTSIIYNITGSRRRKSKLAHLSKVFLGQIIQEGESSHGHDPQEDAIAAMKLVLLKLKKGYEYGDVLLDGSVPSWDENNILNNELLSTTLFKQAKKSDRKVCVIGHSDTLSKYQKYSKDCSKLGSGNIIPKDTSCPNLTEKGPEMAHFETAESNLSALESSFKSCFDNHLTLCHLYLELNRDETDKEAKAVGDTEEVCKKLTSVEKKVMKRARKFIQQLWSHTSTNGLFITIWPGSETQNAFVGVAINKAKVDYSQLSIS